MKRAIIFTAILVVFLASKTTFAAVADSVWTDSIHTTQTVADLYTGYNLATGDYCLTKVGLTTVYTDSTVPQYVPAGTSTIMQHITGLLPNSTYHYVTKFKASAAKVTGTFTTDGCGYVPGITLSLIDLCSTLADATPNDSAIYSFKWYKGGVAIPGATSHQYLIKTSGLYSVRVYSSTCSLLSSDQDVTIAGINVTISGPSAICFGDSATLTASGADVYTWMPGNLTGETITVNPNVTTTYTVTGATFSGSCSKAVSQKLTVNKNSTKVTFTVPPSKDSTCFNSPTNINLQGMGNPSGGGYGGPGVSGTLFIPPTAPIGTNELSYTITDANRCKAIAYASVYVLPVQVVDTMILTDKFKIEGYFPYEIKIAVKSKVYEALFQSNTSALFDNVDIDDKSTVIITSKVGGCYVDKTFHAFPYGVGSLSVKSVKVYPNPFTDVLNINLPDGKYQMTITDMSGKVRFQKTFFGNVSINKGSLTTGTYILGIVSSNGDFFSEKIIIQ